MVQEKNADMTKGHALNLIQPFLVQDPNSPQTSFLIAEEIETNPLKKESIILRQKRDQQLIKTFLSELFPDVLTLEPTKHLEQEGVLEIDAWIALQELILAHANQVGTKEIFHIEFFLEQESNNTILLALKKEIEKVDNARYLERDSMIMLDIDDDCKTLSRVFYHNTPQEEIQRKKFGLIALKSLYLTYKKHPEAQNFILGRLPYYKSHIKYLAKDFCKEKNMLPATDLNPFRLIVRGYRTEQEQEAAVIAEQTNN
jgi:hypothetical protein